MTDKFSGSIGLGDGRMAPVAISQLEAWRYYAWRWGLALHLKFNEKLNRDEWHLTCAGLELTASQQDGWGPCGQTILVMHDGANPYHVTNEIILDRLVAHLRNFHRKIETVVYSGDYEKLK